MQHLINRLKLWRPSIAVINYIKVEYPDLFFFALLIIYTCVCYCVFPTLEYINTNAVQRIYETQAWFRGEPLDHLPLYYWLLGGVSFLTPTHVEIVGRLISFIFSITSLCAYYRLLRLISSPLTTFVSTAMLAFSSLYLLYSLQTLEHMLQLGLIFTMIFYFYRLQQQSSWPNVAALSFCIILTSLLRYECWVIIFAILLLLFYAKKTKPIMLIPPLLSAIVPIALWLILKHTHFTNRMLVASATNHLQFLPSNAWSFLKILYSYLGPLAFIGLITSQLKNNRTMRSFNIITLALIIFFLLGTSAHLIESDNIRYYILLVALLIPVINQGWCYFSKWQYPLVVLYLVTTITIGNLFHFRYRKTDQAMLLAGKYLELNSPNDSCKIYVDATDGNSRLFKLFTQTGCHTKKESFFRRILPETITPDKVLTQEEFIPTHIVVKEKQNSWFWNKTTDQGRKLKLEDHLFIRTISFPPYHIYQNRRRDSRKIR